jgi:hypothetical protein
MPCTEEGDNSLTDKANVFKPRPVLSMTGCNGKPEDVREGVCERVSVCDVDCEREPVWEGDLVRVGVLDCVCVGVTEAVIVGDCVRVSDGVSVAEGEPLKEAVPLPVEVSLGVEDELGDADELREPESVCDDVFDIDGVPLDVGEKDGVPEIVPEMLGDCDGLVLCDGETEGVSDDEGVCEKLWDGDCVADID